MRGLSAVLATWLLGGCISTTSVLEDSAVGPPIVNGTPNELAARAEREFARQPRTAESAARAFMLMREAARLTEPESPERLPRLTEAARYGIWVARHAEDGNLRQEHADAVIVVCNTAVRDAPQAVQGYYYRAVATGLLAQESNIYGPDAMGLIQEDAREAIALDPDYEHAGPHRVLGALHLRAPGPPAGPGSHLRAIRHLEEAVRRAPDYPGNLLFLAEAYLDAGRELEEARRLLARVPGLIDRWEDAADRRHWRQWLADLIARAPNGPRASGPPDP